jgi:hypothetical protein
MTTRFPRTFPLKSQSPTPRRFPDRDSDGTEIVIVAAYEMPTALAIITSSPISPSHSIVHSFPI